MAASKHHRDHADAGTRKPMMINTAMLARTAFHVTQASPLTKVVFCAVVLMLGLGCAWRFVRPPTTIGGSHSHLLQVPRPWRQQGAAICLLLSVMFVLGVALVDIPDNPRAYAAYWLVILVLVAWLCVLAVRDLALTRQLMIKARAAQRTAAQADRSGRQPASEIDK